MWLGALLLREHTGCNPGLSDELQTTALLSLGEFKKPEHQAKSLSLGRFEWEFEGSELFCCAMCGGMTGNCLTCYDSFALRQRWPRRRWMEVQLHKPNWFKWLFKILFISRTFMLDKEAGALRSRNTTLNVIMNNSKSWHIKNNGISPPGVLKYVLHRGWGPVLVDLMPVTLSHLCFQYNYWNITISIPD